MPDGRAMRVSTVLSASLALIAGGLQAMAIASPWDGQPQAWLQVLSMMLLAWLLLRQQSSGALLGWLFATAWLAGSFWWMFIAMYRYGGLPAPLAVLAVLALSGALALYAAVACALYSHLSKRLGPHRPYANALLFAGLWLLAELARGRWLTGFGWGGAGYAHVEGPLAAYAPWIGVYGITAVTAWLAMMLAYTPQHIAEVVRAREWALGAGAWRDPARAALAMVLVLSLPLVQQQWWPLNTRSTGMLRITLLQGNIPQDLSLIHI